MSLESIIIVILYSLKPYWWAVAALILIPVICFFVKPEEFSIDSKPSMIIGLGIGVIAALAAPYLTLSKLSYILTVTDWVSFFGIIIGAAFYVWLNLQLLSRKA